MSDDQLTRTEGWQPIGTAPRDGTHIDLWLVATNGDQYRLTDCHFVESRQQWHGIAEYIWDDDESPTHWRPFPAPPEAI